MRFPNQQGQAIVLGIVLIAMAIAVAQFFTSSFQRNLIQFGSQILVPAILGFFLVRGYNWARIVMLILFGLAAVTSLVAGALFIGQDFWEGMILILPGLFYFVAVLIFLGGKNVREHFGV